MPPKKQVQKIRVANTEIVLGTTYELIDKTDYDAPTPIKGGEPTVKYSTPGNGEIRSVVFDEDSQRWDTGFEVTSPCNRRIKTEDKAVLVDSYVKFIQKPYEQYYSVDTNSTNNDFWGGNDSKEIKPYLFEIKKGKTYDTTNPRELFDLFHALKQGKICNVGEKDAEIQEAARYCVRNREELVSFEDEKLQNKLEAYSTLSNLVGLDSKNDDTLLTVLEWTGYPNVRSAEKEALKKLVLKSFENEKTGIQSVKRFLEAYNYTKSSDMRQEMEMFGILSRLNLKNKLERKREQYYIDNHLLGTNLKSAAASVLKNEEIKKIVLDTWEKVQQ